MWGVEPGANAVTNAPCLETAIALPGQSGAIANAAASMADEATCRSRMTANHYL